MKKRKIVKNVSLVALSAVLACGVAAAFTGCANDTYTLSVSIFCNDSDEHTNRTICENWAKEYSEKLGFDIAVDLSVNNDKDTYFEELGRAFSNDSAEDVIYLSPKYVKNWASIGRVMDLSQYVVNGTKLDPKEETTAAISNLWENGLSYYGYKKGDSNYVLGQTIKYDATSNKLVTTANNTEVELYGLPKDYSNFAMGYNKKFFTDELKAQYQTVRTDTERSVQGGYNATKDVTFTGKKANGTDYNVNPVTYAVGITKEQCKAHTDCDGHNEGDPAPLINIGVPTRYRPFNFYRYASYDDALEGGDPMAVACNELTRYRQGYVVTIPGFPGDTFTVDSQYQDANAPYDTATGHVVFTYAEFGALTWAVTYYLNTFDWDAQNPLAGQGGVTTKTSGQMNIFGNEQYEGAQGNPLYLLPWLASNDADFIDLTSTKAMNNTTAPDTTNTTAKASTFAGTNTNNVTKLNLDGSTRTAAVQYGIDSARFIETYAAFHEYGSTWNGNSGNAGDTLNNRQESGWDLFRMGAGVFYGAGTWDAATRNESETDTFEFGEMPTPVAEKYALYTATKDADYEHVVYSNAGTKGTGDAVNNEGAQRSNPEDGLSHGAYTYDEIVANQLLRQDKWAGRMDSVGYAANGKLASYVGTEEEWKIEGAASLIMALTIKEDAQKTLTYAGAQLPNFRGQCIDFLNYQTAGADGAFKDMITPEGFYDTTDPATGKAIWDHYYAIAKEMAAASYSSSLTVGEWIQTKKDYNSDAVARYDEQYKDVPLNKFVGESTHISFAMKVLRMVNFDKTDRDLNIRMQYGLNSVRDSSMYTFTNTWIGSIDSSSTGKMLAYIKQASLKSYNNKNMIGDLRAIYLQATPGATQAELQAGKGMLWTPAVYCINSADTVQKALTRSINEEASSIR